MTQQRVGPVHITLEGTGRSDLTVVDVPEDCVGFCMGRGGATLRSMEEEWGTLMFFAQVGHGVMGQVYRRSGAPKK